MKARAKESLSLHDGEGLRRHYNLRYRAPRAIGLLSATDELEPGMDLAPIPGLFDFVRAALANHRVRYCAYQWLRPETPVRTIEQLGALKRSSGLQYMKAQEFIQRTIDACIDFGREDAAIRWWVDHRIALLEYARFDRRLSRENLDAALVGYHVASCNATAALARGNALEARTLITEALESVLEVAANAIGGVLGVANCRVNGNLMLPLARRSDGYYAGFSAQAVANEVIARELWKGLETDSNLVVVAETRSAGHTGFWCPLAVSQHSGEHLPGAPTAYHHMDGHAVFKSDLPETGFGAEVDGRWKEFMHSSFKQAMFVSIPILVAGNGGSLNCMGVFNVNADPNPECGWVRASHVQWLRLAREAAAPFLHEALTLSALLLHSYGVRWKTGLPAWDGIAGFLPAKGGSDVQD